MSYPVIVLMLSMLLLNKKKGGKAYAINDYCK